jgi:hypothetical protein
LGRKMRFWAGIVRYWAGKVEWRAEPAMSARQPGALTDAPETAWRGACRREAVVRPIAAESRLSRQAVIDACARLRLGKGQVLFNAEEPGSRGLYPDKIAPNGCKESVRPSKGQGRGPSSRGWAIRLAQWGAEPSICAASARDTLSRALPGLRGRISAPGGLGGDFVRI